MTGVVGLAVALGVVLVVPVAVTRGVVVALALTRGVPVALALALVQTAVAVLLLAGVLPVILAVAVVAAAGDLLVTARRAGLVAGTVVTAGLYVVAKQQRRHTTLSHLLMGLLAYLVAVQFLLLPVNYGMLIADKTMPRVVNLGDLAGFLRPREGRAHSLTAPPGSRAAGLPAARAGP